MVRRILLDIVHAFARVRLLVLELVGGVFVDFRLAIGRRTTLAQAKVQAVLQLREVIFHLLELKPVCCVLGDDATFQSGEFPFFRPRVTFTDERIPQ